MITRNDTSPFPVCGSLVRCVVIAAMLGFGSQVLAQSLDTPQTRLRPISAPSAVDQYRGPAPNGRWDRSAARVPRPAVQETSYVRQAAMQNFEMPGDPSGGVPSAGSPFNGGPGSGAPFVPPPASGSPVLPPNTFSQPPSTFSQPPNTFSQPPSVQSSPAPRNLPPPVGPSMQSPASGSIVSPSDLTPIAPPQLSGGFATLSNCNCVSGPSTYSAASGIGCGQVGYQAPIGYGPAINPAINPPFNPTAIAAPPIASGAPASALIDFGQTAAPVRLGPGLIGQPKAYVTGQYFRNWLRYFTP